MLLEEDAEIMGLITLKQGNRAIVDVGLLNCPIEDAFSKGVTARPEKVATTGRDVNRPRLFARKGIRTTLQVKVVSLKVDKYQFNQMFLPEAHQTRLREIFASVNHSVGLSK